jgi:SPP1 gp7 family putative phage head morphogenesis protein
MADEAHILTDKKLEEMERHLSAIYSDVEKSVAKSWQEYIAESSKEIDALQKAYDDAKASGDKDAIRKAGKKLQRAKKEKTILDEHYQALTERAARDLATVNEKALAYINGEVPEIYVANYNALKESVDGVGGYAFELIDADTVKHLALTDDSLLPFKVLDPAKDIPWNMRNINTQVLQGILAGEPMDKISRRIKNVQSMNEVSAMRAARTLVTEAENKGRQDSYQQAEDDGIIIHKEWIATADNRTRHMHRELDGKTVPQDKPFVVDDMEIMFPADPEADPSLVYNCRCTIGAVVKGFKKVKKQK